MLWKIISNGYIPIIPILIWNVVFASKLPPAFDPKSFNSGIPTWIMVGENIFRSFVFILPLIFRINISSPTGKTGLLIYLTGVFLYFCSWMLLMAGADSFWSTSLIGFMAPAYTPLIWLVGISLMVESYYFRFLYSKWHYLLPSVAFILFHLVHTFQVYQRNY